MFRSFCCSKTHKLLHILRSLLPYLPIGKKIETRRSVFSLGCKIVCKKLAFSNRDVSPAMGAACPGATAAKMNSTTSGRFRTKSRPKGGPSPGCGSSKRAGFFRSAHCISLEWGAAARKLSHGRLKTPARGAGLAGHCLSSVTPKIHFSTLLFRKNARKSRFGALQRAFRSFGCS